MSVKHRKWDLENCSGISEIVLIAMFLFWGCSSSSAELCGPSTGVVVEVLDGDTVTLEDGTRIRYLLIDAPEISNGENECFGIEARDFNRDLVLNKEVELSYDEECLDAFGRLLAYVTIDGRSVNQLMVERGYACALYIRYSK